MGTAVGCVYYEIMCPPCVQINGSVGSLKSELLSLFLKGVSTVWSHRIFVPQVWGWVNFKSLFDHF